MVILYWYLGIYYPKNGEPPRWVSLLLNPASQHIVLWMSTKHNILPSQTLTRKHKKRPFEDYSAPLEQGNIGFHVCFPERKTRKPVKQVMSAFLTILGPLQTQKTENPPPNLQDLKCKPKTWLARRPKIFLT